MRPALALALALALARALALALALASCTLGPMRTAIVALAIAAFAAAAWEVRRDVADLDVPVDRHGAAFAGSGACARCHPDHHASWARTHHRRMTQEASDETMLGAFDGRTLAYGGYVARMDRNAAGAFVVSVESARHEPLTRWTVERLVGSRRQQQLLAREDDLWVRLPIAWDVEEGRFFHMNGAFLTSDPEGLGGEAPIASSDYMRHAVRWNDNCVFCHNVGAEPRARSDGPLGLGAHEPAQRHWDTRVAELGVACEACHGPGVEHVRANASPFRRYVLHETGRADPTITAPSRLARERQTDLCARCHGQRITDDMSRYLAHGDPFVPGDVLADTSRPLAIDTPLHGDTAAFAPRFWRDGTARLTAYEHQGVEQSRCGVTCSDCHAMHEGDPRGQLRPDRLGDAMCAGECHVELANVSAARAHSDHVDVACVDCHMPRIVFGIRAIHRSHRIEVPDPNANARDGRPDACSLCHVDARLEDELFGGDPIERAVAAAALGRADHTDARARRLALLFETMRGDSYPAVRGIAWRSARSLGVQAEVEAFTATDDGPTRARAVAALAAREIVVTIDDPRIALLRARADAHAIEVGE